MSRLDERHFNGSSPRNWVWKVCFLRRAYSGSRDREHTAFSCPKVQRAQGPLRVLTQGFADITDSSEHHSREADSQPHRLHVRQAQAKHFMLRGEDKVCICLDSTFVQGPVRFQEPATLLFPPKGKVWPVLGYVCKNRKHSEVQGEGGHASQFHRAQKCKQRAALQCPISWYTPRLNDLWLLFKESKARQVENRLNLTITDTSILRKEQTYTNSVHLEMLKFSSFHLPAPWSFLGRPGALCFV